MLPTDSEVPEAESPQVLTDRALLPPLMLDALLPPRVHGGMITSMR
jgi:hypothetical protein